jgi:hypothetical protein
MVDRLRIATTAANAAAGANEIATQALITSQRPYVVHQQAFGGQADLVHMFRGESGAAPGVVFRPYWSNLGNTPTHNLRVYVSQMRAISAPFTDVASYDFSILNDVIYTPIALGPHGETILGDAAVLSSEELSNPPSTRKDYYVFGWAEYNDGFKETRLHKTRFCEIITFNTPPLGDTKADVNVGNSFCPVRYQCIDEQCASNNAKAVPACAANLCAHTAPLLTHVTLPLDLARWLRPRP